jgi:arylsulfatase A-like enzyme
VIARLFILSTVLGLAGVAEIRPSRGQPNIIVILTDDMGIGDVGAYGGKQTRTPNIDRMATEGTRFTQYYSASPICSPSRAALITGMHPARWRITSFLQARKGNAGCEMVDYLDPRASSLPRALRESGYVTAHFGKWHLGGGRDVNDAPKFAAYGYDEHASTYESPEPHPDLTTTDWIWSEKDAVKRWDRTGFFVDKTLSFLDRHRDQPCFINLWPDDIHTPWVPDEVSDRKDLPNNLHPVLAEYDRQIGRLLDGLKARGIERDTIVIFTSDNGALPTFGGSRSGRFRGHKLALWEGGIRMPFIVWWPGRVAAGRVDEQSVVTAVDLFPTLCVLAGAKRPVDAPLEGVDISPALFGGTLPGDRRLFWEYGRNQEFFKFGPDPSPNLAMRQGSWKLLINADGLNAHLFDLERDPGESTNLATQNPDVVKRMTALVMNWRASWPTRP